MFAGAVGYRVTPVPADMPPPEAKRRPACGSRAGPSCGWPGGESVAILALVLSFVTDPPSVLTYLVGGAVTLLLFRLHVWPSAEVVARSERALDAAGGRSYLGGALAGHEPGSSAPGDQRF